MIAVGDQHRDPVADKTDRPGQRVDGHIGRRLWIDDAPDRFVSGNHGRKKITATTDRPAYRSALRERIRNAIPSGTAVNASPKLWIKSASSAMLPDNWYTASWIAAVRPSTVLVILTEPSKPLGPSEIRTLVEHLK